MKKIKNNKPKNKSPDFGVELADLLERHHFVDADTLALGIRLINAVIFCLPMYKLSSKELNKIRINLIKETKGLIGKEIDKE